MLDWCLDRDKTGHYWLQAGDRVPRRAIIGGAGVIAADGHILEDSTHHLYKENTQREHMEIKTHYEHIFLNEGKPITYLRFQLNG